MFENNFRRPPIPQQKPKGDGCKMRIKRDENGRIIGYQDNGQCSSQQIKAFNDKLNMGESDYKEEE
jgi:hypothetical protein